MRATTHPKGVSMFLFAVVVAFQLQIYYFSRNFQTFSRQNGRSSSSSSSNNAGFGASLSTSKMPIQYHIPLFLRS